MDKKMFSYDPSSFVGMFDGLIHGHWLIAMGEFFGIGSVVFLKFCGFYFLNNLHPTYTARHVVGLFLSM